MTFTQDEPQTGTWLLSFGLALAAHAGILFFGLISMSDQRPPERKATEINVSAMSLETPKANAGATKQAVADRAKAEAASAVESLSAENAASEKLAAIADKDQADSIKPDAAQTAGSETAHATQAAEKAAQSQTDRQPQISRVPKQRP